MKMFQTMINSKIDVPTTIYSQALLGDLNLVDYINIPDKYKNFEIMYSPDRRKLRTKKDTVTVNVTYCK